MTTQTTQNPVKDFSREFPAQEMTEGQIASANFDDLCGEYRRLLDEKEACQSIEKKISKALTTLGDALLERMRSQGVEKMSARGVTVWINERDFVKVEPQKWDAIAKQLVIDGHSALIQKRISVKPLEELQMDGYRLPDGLTIDSMPVLNHRRS